MISLDEFNDYLLESVFSRVGVNPARAMGLNRLINAKQGMMNQGMSNVAAATKNTSGKLRNVQSFSKSPTALNRPQELRQTPMMNSQRSYMERADNPNLMSGERKAFSNFKSRGGQMSFGREDSPLVQRTHQMGHTKPRTEASALGRTWINPNKTLDRKRILRKTFV